MRYLRNLVLLLWIAPLASAQNSGGASYSTGGSGSITVPGSDTQCIFNDAGALGADAGCVFNKTTDTLTVTNIGATTLTGTNLLSGRNTFGTAADAINAIDFNETAGHITFEGAAADTAEARLIHSVNSGFDTVTTIPVLGASQTVAISNLAQSWSGTQTFGGQIAMSGALIVTADNNGVSYGASGNGNPIIYNDTSHTPDGGVLGTGSTSNSWTIQERADFYDAGNGACGTAACTHPSLIIKAATQDQTNYNTLSYAGSASKSVKALTESAATSTVRIALAAEAGTGGTYHYSIYATDGSTPQIRQGRVIFSVTNDGGTETCVLGTPEETDNTPTGTLTVTVTCDTTPTNAVDFQLNAVSSLTQTSLDAYSHVTLVGSGELQPQ